MLSACSGMSSTDKGTIAGAAVGGVAGSALTGGSAIGTIGGAAAGGALTGGLLAQPDGNQAPSILGVVPQVIITTLTYVNSTNTSLHHVLLLLVVDEMKGYHL
jgi:osmotically inducible lipoprotein OsmB